MSNLKEATPTPEAKLPGSVNPETGAVQQADTAGAYLRASLVRIKGGETGILPVVGGLLLVSILFQSLNNHFLTAGNLVNLLVQAAVFSLLAMGEVFALLLGEIDLSAGFVAGLSAVVMAELVQPSVGWPWWAAIGAALVVCALVGALQGSLITRIGLPSFVVTLSGLLFWQGVMLYILGDGGSILIQDNVINDIGSGTLTRVAGWVVMLLVVGVFAIQTWRRDQRRRGAGLMAPPQSRDHREDPRGAARWGVARPAVQRRPRLLRPGLRGALGHSSRLRRRRGMDVRARPAEVRTLHLRHRRQR